MLITPFRRLWRILQICCAGYVLVGPQRAGPYRQDHHPHPGLGAGMTAFMSMTSWSGLITAEYFDRPEADPTQFGGLRHVLAGTA